MIWAWDWVHILYQSISICILGAFLSSSQKVRVRDEVDIQFVSDRDGETDEETDK